MLSTDITHAAVAEAVQTGFSKTPRRLPSWLFYDTNGDRIFQAIMQMPEYYLTGCEYEILQIHQQKLQEHFMMDGSAFDLVEFGAGDGLKTEILLRYFIQNNIDFSYLPVDVSKSVLNQLSARLKASVPGLRMKPVNKRYEEAIHSLHTHDLNRKVFLFLGANIGNFSVSDAINFVTGISAGMEADDQLLIGFDLKKDPRLILAAYDDPHGITRDFNLNLLVRLNRELGAQFRLDQFSHFPYYDPETGSTKSYLISLKDQHIYFECFSRSIHFKQWEVIHTEVSQKYDIAMIEAIAQKANLEIVEYFYDSKRYFCDVLFRKR